MQQSVIKAIKSHSFLSATVVVLVIYVAILWWLPKNVFWSPDEGAKFLNMHTISLDDGLRFTIPYNGRYLDPDFQFYPGDFPKGHVYPQPSDSCNIEFNWPLWFPLLSLFPYRLFGIWGLYLLPLLCGWGTAVLSGVIVRRIQPKAAVGTVLVVGFATPILFYSVLFWEHTLAVFLGLLAIWLILEWPRRIVKWSIFLGIGGLLLLGTALRMETTVFAVSLFLALILALWPQNKRNIWIQFKQELFDYKWHYLTSIILLAAVAWLLFIAKPPQENSPASYCKADRNIGEMAVNSIKKNIKSSDAPPPAPVLDFEDNESWNKLPRLFNLLFLSEDLHPSARLLTIGIVGVILIFMGVFVTGQHQVVLWVAGVTLVAFFVTSILLSEERYRFIRSIFLPAPYLLLVFYIGWWKRTYSRQIIAHIALIYLILGTVAVLWRETPGMLAGPEWGARYMLHFYPIAAIGTMVMLGDIYEKMGDDKKYNSKIMIGSALFLISLSILFNIRGLYELALTKTDLQTQQEILSIENIPVVSDLFWLPGSLAPYFLHHEMYILDDPIDLYTWIDMAAPHAGLFYYVSFKSLPSLPPSSNYSMDVEVDQNICGLNITKIKIISHQ